MIGRLAERRVPSTLDLDRAQAAEARGRLLHLQREDRDDRERDQRKEAILEPDHVPVAVEGGVARRAEFVGENRNFDEAMRQALVGAETRDEDRNAVHHGGVERLRRDEIEEEHARDQHVGEQRDLHR